MCLFVAAAAAAAVAEREKNLQSNQSTSDGIFHFSILMFLYKKKQKINSSEVCVLAENMTNLKMQ